MQFIKLSELGGAQRPDYMFASRASVGDVLPYYQDFIKSKAIESKTPAYKAVGSGLTTGGLLGGLIGTALGFGRGNAPAGLAVGALVGGGIGTILGLIGKAIDDGDVEKAKQLVASSNFNDDTKRALLEELYGEDARKELLESYRHREIVSRLK